MRAEDLIGQQISDYHIEAIIGKGSMTVVYRARDVGHNRSVALKVLFPPQESDLIQARFQQEAAFAKQLDHPHIVPVLDVGDIGGQPYLVMPLMRAGSLAERLRLLGKLDEATAVDVIWQIADALHYAHTRGIIHRDIKPSNILIAEDNQVMLADFGVARALDDPRLTNTGLAVGTPFYMAPEQAAGQKALDGRVDLYALGVVLYQLVTGRMPFSGSTPQVLYAHVHEMPPAPSELTNVSPALEYIIFRAMAKRPDERYQTGADMAEAIAKLDDVATDAQTDLFAHPVKVTKPSYGKYLILAIGLVAVLAGGWLYRQPMLATVGLTTPTPMITIEHTIISAATSLPTQTATATIASTTTPVPTSTDIAEAVIEFDAPLPPGTLIKGDGDGVFRVANDLHLQHIFDWETFLAFGYQEADIVSVDEATLTEWPRGEPLTRIIKDDAGLIYWIVGGERWAVQRWQDALQALDPSTVDNGVLDELTFTVNIQDLPIHTVLTSNSQMRYLLVEEGVIRRISDTLLPVFGLMDNEPVVIPEPVLFAYQVGLPLTRLLQSEGTEAGAEAVYLLEDGRRRAMPAGADLWALGYGVEDISFVPPSFIERFPLFTEPFAACTELPSPAFTALLTDHVDLSDKLGCAINAAQTSGTAWQPFENGHMLWRKDTGLIYILPINGPWDVSGDTWREGDPIADPDTIAPDDLYQPVRGFGNVWRQLPGVRDTLGWGLSEEIGTDTQIQTFEGGFVVGPIQPDAVDNEVTFILFDDQSYDIR